MRLNTLIKMLRFRRPMGSRTEQNFRRYFLHSLPDAWEDPHRNIHVLIAREDGGWPKVVWSCHTDTVHRVEGLQKVRLRRGLVALDPTEHVSNCLGADCTIGVWLMREMILAGVPGHYVFHWGEERGCIGSSAVVKKNPEYFRHAKAIIAFDRRHGDEVITFQRGRRTCSDVFAESVAAMLPRGYKPSAHGVYTDSAEYDKLIPECTNIGVGYDSEHSVDETVNLKVVVQLLSSILKWWDEDNVIIERDPTKVEMKIAPAQHSWHGYRKTKDHDPLPAIYKQGEYHVWENGCLVKYASEQARMEAWLKRKADEDERKLIDDREMFGYYNH